MYVAIAGDATRGQILTSPTGTRWAHIETGKEGALNLTGIAVLGSLVCVTTDSTSVPTLVSSDRGQTWTPATVAMSAVLTGIVAAGDRFMAVSGGHIHRSTDGLAWTVTTGGTATMTAAAYDPATATWWAADTDAGGHTYTSTDGAAWVYHGIQSDWKLSASSVLGVLWIAYDTVTVGGADGPWTTVSMDMDQPNRHGVAAGPSSMIAWGSYSVKVYTGGAWADAVTTLAPTYAVWDDGLNQYLAMTDSGLHASLDGSTWTALASDAPTWIIGLACVPDLPTLNTDVGAGTVVHHVVSVAGITPRAVPGISCTFRAAPRYLRDVNDTPGPQTVLPEPVVCAYDSAGYLIGADGFRGTQLVASGDTDIDPHGWQWTATISAPGIADIAAAFTLAVGGTVDLTDVIPTAGV